MRFSAFNLDVNIGSPSKKETEAVQKPVDLKEVVTVLNGVYGGTQNLDKEQDTFPLQQKLLICSLLLILNKGRNKDITVGRVSSSKSRIIIIIKCLNIKSQHPVNYN